MILRLFVIWKRFSYDADSEEDMERFKSDPKYYYEYRRELEKILAGGFDALWKGSDAQEQLRKTTIKHMEQMITDPKILATLIPEFEIGCRRFTPGDHYLRALQQSNVSMVSDHIRKVTETSIIDATGTANEVDVIVCATGFDASFTPRFPIIGLDGYSLAENWGAGKPTESYMGAMVARFPNHFGMNLTLFSLTKYLLRIFLLYFCPLVESMNNKLF